MLKVQHFTFISSVVPQDKLLKQLESERRYAVAMHDGWPQYGKVDIVHVQRIGDGIDLCHLYVSFESRETDVSRIQAAIDEAVVGYFRSNDANSFILFGLHQFAPIIKE